MHGRRVSKHDPLTVIIVEECAKNCDIHFAPENLSTGRVFAYQLHGAVGGTAAAAQASVGRRRHDLTNDIGFAISASVAVRFKMGQRNRAVRRKWHRRTGWLRDRGWQGSC